jgi:hypothetical protein
MTTIIRCNMCMRLFNDESELQEFTDVDGPLLGCPDCETDEYLMDIDLETAEPC